jgi:hypothetical protein
MADGQQGGQNVQEIIKVLKNKGMTSAELLQLFGPMLGVGGASNNYDDLFAQYMPTFGQINQSEPENSLRRSIAAEVMAGTPIWQIEEGISNAITSNDPGVSPSARYEDYVGLAKTLTNEYQNYNTQTSKPGNQSVFDKYGIPTPEQRYTVETMFPDVIGKLAELKKMYPESSTETLRAKMPNTMAPSSTGVSNVSSELDEAKQALRSGVQSYNFNGRNYGLTELRDVVIPQLEEKSKSEKLTRNAMEQKVAQSKTRTYEVDNMTRRAQDSVRKNEAELRKANSLFANKKIDEKDLRLVQSNYNSSLEMLARTKGLGSQAESLYSALKPKSDVKKTPVDKVVRETQSDPYFGKVSTGVLSGLQEKIDQSGRTPQMDAIYRLLQSGLIGK